MKFKVGKQCFFLAVKNYIQKAPTLQEPFNDEDFQLVRDKVTQGYRFHRITLSSIKTQVDEDIYETQF